ncbi:hypothetical protein KI387_019780, partial [Taxus chinensis]
TQGGGHEAVTQICAHKSWAERAVRRGVDTPFSPPLNLFWKHEELTLFVPEDLVKRENTRYGLSLV